MADKVANERLHIAMFPWLAFGHIIPYIELAKHIAQKGHKVSFISTTRNIQRLPKLPQNLTPHIELISLSLPQVPNLPVNAEATMDLLEEQVQYLKKAFDGLKDSVSEFLVTSKPDWIIHDLTPYWLPTLASSLGVSGAFFSIFNAPCFCFFVNMREQDQRCKPEDYTVPPKWVTFPSKVAYRLYEVKKIVNNYMNEINASGISDAIRVNSVVSGCEVILVRSTMSIEGNYINLLRKINTKPVFPVGLLPPISSNNIQVNENDDELEDQTWRDIKEWLNKQEKESVVYIAFGSESTMSQEELIELALGIELSKLPFLWALRNQQISDNELLTGFKERTKGYGLIWTSWLPQTKILSHESIGGFLTHAGWTSIIEALCYGVPLVMFPLMVDQGLNARFVEDEIKGVGIEIPRGEEDGSFTRYSVAQSLKKVLVGEESKIYSKRAKEMSSVFRDMEFQESYIDQMLAHLQQHKPAHL